MYTGLLLGMVKAMKSFKVCLFVCLFNCFGFFSNGLNI